MPKKKPVQKSKRKRAVLPLKKIKRKAPKKPFRAMRQTTIPITPEPETMVAIEVETERKLSAKIIVGKRIGKIEAPTDLFTVIGIATGIRTGQSTYGEWTGLKGEFEVVRCEDGKVLQAPIMILPDRAWSALFPESPSAPVFPFEFAMVVSVDPAT